MYFCVLCVFLCVFCICIFCVLCVENSTQKIVACKGEIYRGALDLCVFLEIVEKMVGGQTVIPPTLCGR